MFPIMQTTDEQKAIYNSRFKTRHIQQIVLAYESEWRNALLLSIRDRERRFECILIENVGIDVLLIHDNFDEIPLYPHISFLWQFQEHFNIISNDYNEFYFCENFYKYYTKDTLESYTLYDFVTNPEMAELIEQLTKCYFITLKQQYVDCKIKNLLMSFMHDFYKTMDITKMQKIKQWKLFDRILMDEYVLGFVVKY